MVPMLVHAVGWSAMSVSNQTPTTWPISFAQQRMWFLDQLHPQSTAYQIADAFRLRGVLDTGALASALSEIVARHEVLRTTFPATDGRPIQVVAPAGPVELDIVDLSHAPDPEAAARRAASDAGRERFDLACGPLLRARLLVLGPNDHVLVLVLHHIITDGWSAEVFTRELAAQYRASRDHQPATLDVLPMQYGAFAAHQRDRMTGDTLAQHLAYWTGQLRDCPPVLDLPTDRPRPSVRAGRGARIPMLVPPHVVNALEGVGRTQRATLFMVLLAAFQVVLSRYSGQEDLAVGTPIAGRNQGATESLIGCFVNTLVLRADLSGDPTFAQFVGRVRNVALDGYDHQDLPFELLVEASNPERSLGHSPLFQHLFVFQNTPKSNLLLPDIESCEFDLDRDGSMFDLTLDLAPSDGQVSGWLEYDTDLFDRETATAVAGHYLHLLEKVAADADRPLSQLDFLEEAEREQLLVGFNDTSSAFPDETMHQGFERWADRQPDATAVRDAVGSLSYRQLNEGANKLAHHLRHLGVGPETRVGICVRRGSAMVVSMLAVLKAGGGYVPLSPDYPAERLRFMLDDSAVAVLLTESGLLERLPDHRALVVCLDDDDDDADGTHTHTDGPEIASHCSVNPASLADPDNLAYVIYTSGSTGRPKGVMIEHRGVVSLLSAAGAIFTQGELRVVVAAASMSFDLSVFEVFVTLMNGGSIYIAANLLDPSWCDVGPTMVNAVPSVLAAVLAVRDLPSTVVTVVLAGEALGADLVRTIRARSAPGTPPLRLVNIYGPTEATIYATSAEIEHAAPLSEIIPIGRPVANTSIYLLDRHGRPVPIGAVGEVYIGGVGVGRGYLNRGPLDGERFLPDPFGPARSRVYRTGDLARYRRDGTIDFLGRMDDQVKIRGFRIEPAEVRAVLLTHPDVADAAVIVRQDMPGRRQLVAYVVARGEDLASSALRAHLAQTLPRYMLPSAIVLIESLPRNASGKLDRRALPPPAEGQARPAPVAPRTDTERILADIWAQVLGVTSVGMTDDFFDLGGHSLLAAHVLARAEQAFGQKLPLALILRTGTVEALARVIDLPDRSGTLWQTVFPLKLGGSGVPVFCVHGLTGTITAYRQVITYLSDDHPVYGIQSSGLDGVTPPYSRVEDMAAHYLDEMQAVQPVGPYVVIGICFGSLVAFEMAHQLTAGRGCQVALVALIDPTPLPVRTFGERARRRVGKFWRTPARDSLPFLRETMNVTVELASSRIRTVLRRERSTVTAVNARASELYVPPDYDGRVVVYRSEGLRTHPDENRALAWDTLQGDNVEVVDIHGASHVSLLTEANIPIVATHLRDSIDRALSPA